MTNVEHALVDDARIRVSLERVFRVEAVPVVVIGTFVLLSTAIRSVISLRHETARYFPDEYIYTELARAIAHGHLEVRDHPAHFPSLLQPLLAAPLWRFFSPATAYHLVQVENALAASSAAIPVYLLARHLDLDRRLAYLCSAYALVVPTLVMTSLTITDFIAYPLVLGAVAAAVQALDRGGRKPQVLFLVLACLATFARIQYFVLVPAYIVGSLLLHRRRFLREHRLVLLAVAPAAVGLLVALKGFYSGIGSIPIGFSVVTWFPLQLFLLALVSGIVVAPGAAAALIRPATSVERAYTYFACPLAIAVLGEASVYAASSGRFKERYLFSLTPLIGIWFAVYLKQGRPRRLAVFLVAAALAAAAARLPVSLYTKNAASYDSQFLTAVAWLQSHLSAVSSSLLIAGLATTGSALAVLVALRGGGRIAIVCASAVGLAASAADIHVDMQLNQTIRDALAPDLRWIDHAAQGPVTAIATPVSGSSILLAQLYWNESVDRELLLRSAIPTDSYATEAVAIGSSGELENVRGAFLVDDSGSRSVFSNATELTRWGQYRLYRTKGIARFRLLVEGYTADDWLLPYGRFEVWPKPGSPKGITSTISFTVSLPASRPLPDRVRFANRTFTVRPGQSVHITCGGGRSPLRFGYKSAYGRYDSFLRPLSVRLTDIRMQDVSPGHRSGVGQVRCTHAT